MNTRNMKSDEFGEANNPIIDDLEIRPEDVYAKTLLGVEESRRLQGGTLPPKLRTVLMLIDGRTTFESFSSTLKTYGDVTQLFLILRDLGLIVKTATNPAVRDRVRAERRDDAARYSSPINAPTSLGRTQLRAEPFESQQQQQQQPLIPPLRRPTPEPAIFNEISAPVQPSRPPAQPVQYQEPQRQFVQPNSISSMASAGGRQAGPDMRHATTALCDLLTNELGFDGMDLMVGVERAATPETLRGLLPKIEAALAGTMGASKARDAVNRCGSMIP
jgi:hypothetical protein